MDWATVCAASGKDTKNIMNFINPLMAILWWRRASPT